MILWYLLISSAIALYSYVLIDPNLTLISHPLWAGFRDLVVHIGYYNRPLSTTLFLVLIGVLFYLQKKIISSNKTIRPLTIALAIAIPLLISYPFLSRDFFNYMFDAKILTFYHQNPYLHRALDYPHDSWLRFMHWTHRPYPYGPVFLALTLIPSFLSFGKFILSMLFFKSMWAIFYLASVYISQKKYPTFALFFATSPLVIIEGLVNNHNDLIAIALTIIGAYHLFNHNKIKGYLLLVFSAGIKYFTAPYLLIHNVHSKINLFVFWSLIIGFSYLGIKQEMQPWYLLNLIPFFMVSHKLMNIFTFASLGALLSYYPYLAIGDWTNPEVVFYKRAILAATVLFILGHYMIKRSQLFMAERV